jgi:hypothetical protein
VSFGWFAESSLIEILAERVGETNNVEALYIAGEELKVKEGSLGPSLEQEFGEPIVR